jgi:hypothetical protein
MDNQDLWCGVLLPYLDVWDLGRLLRVSQTIHIWTDLHILSHFKSLFLVEYNDIAMDVAGYNAIQAAFGLLVQRGPCPLHVCMDFLAFHRVFQNPVQRVFHFIPAEDFVEMITTYRPRVNAMVYSSDDDYDE